MTVLGALALDEGCRVLPLFEGSKRQRRGRHALTREWCEVGVCLRGVVMTHFIGRSRVDFFFPLSLLAGSPFLPPNAKPSHNTLPNLRLWSLPKLSP